MTAAVCIFALLILLLEVPRFLAVLLLGWPLCLMGPRYKKYYLNQLVASDQSVNTLCGGDVDETISSRLGKTRDTSKLAAFFARIVDSLFFWDKPSHTKKFIEFDEGKDSVL